MRSRFPAAKPGVSPLEEEPATMDAWAARPRKKGTGLLRTWMMVDSTGQAQVIEAGKHAVMRRTGLPARDLRILDPLLSYPSTVLGRERAIVINLEHIKAIITAQEVLLLNSRDPAVAPFVEELQRRILRSHHALKKQQQQQQMQQTQLHQQNEGRNGSGDAAEWHSGYDSTVSPNSACENLNAGYGGEDGKGEGRLPVFENSDGSRLLPFEFIALEACLEAACSCLETEARTLEHEAHPALDKLTSKISTLNLERVRQIKSRLVAITGRVQKVRDELEHLLDDDEDMAELYLTDKLMQQRLDESSSFASLHERGDSMDERGLPSDMDDGRVPVEASMETNELTGSYQPDIHNLDKEDSLLESSMLRVDSHGTHAVSTDSSNKHLDVEELEMLLEAYFVQIDGTLNKLSTLREYVDDTEDYINIMLDDKQNHLLQMGVMLTTATLVVSAFVVVAGIFGMNINIDLFEKEKAGMPQFLLTVGGGTTGSIIIYIIAIAWCKHKRLLE